MALPDDLTTVTVTGSFYDAGNNAQTGAVLFTPTATVVDSGGEVVITETAVPATVTAGTMAPVTLVATNNAGLYPGNWAYTVTIAVAGAAQTFTAYIAQDSDVSELIPAPAPPSLTGPYVISVNGQSGTITIPGLTNGTVVLSSGTATVLSGNVGSDSVIMLTYQSVSGTTGTLHVGTINPGVSFTIASTSGSDASTVGYQF